MRGRVAESGGSARSLPAAGMVCQEGVCAGRKGACPLPVPWEAGAAPGRAAVAFFSSSLAGRRKRDAGEL